MWFFSGLRITCCNQKSSKELVTVLSPGPVYKSISSFGKQPESQCESPAEVKIGTAKRWSGVSFTRHSRIHENFKHILSTISLQDAVAHVPLRGSGRHAETIRTSAWTWSIPETRFTCIIFRWSGTKNSSCSCTTYMVLLDNSRERWLDQHWRNLTISSRC